MGDAAYEGTEQGLPALRAAWIRARGDVEEAETDQSRCPPGCGGTPVTQRHYARQGVRQEPPGRSPGSPGGAHHDAAAVELEAQEGFGPSSMVARDRLDHQHAPERRNGCRMPAYFTPGSSGTKLPPDAP